MATTRTTRRDEDEDEDDEATRRRRRRRQCGATATRLGHRGAVAVAVLVGGEQLLTDLVVLRLDALDREAMEPLAATRTTYVM